MIRYRLVARLAWKPLIGYGGLLAAGAVGLQWLDYQRLARLHPGDVYLFLVAAGFLALGIFVGARAFAARPPAPFDGNPKAQAELGLSARELEVLHELAAGRANKEIAARLHSLAEHGQNPRRQPVRQARRAPSHRGDPPGAGVGDRAVSCRRSGENARITRSGDCPGGRGRGQWRHQPPRGAPACCAPS